MTDDKTTNNDERAPRRHGEHGEEHGGRKRGKALLLHEEVTEKILGAAIEVHSVLGPGLLESAYEECLCAELRLRGLSFRRQVPLDLDYKGVRIDAVYRIDLIVEECVVVELKSVDALEPIHETQLFSYLRLSGLRVGLLLNFNVNLLRDGVVRRVL
jgi:GxxExxY protein